jgi:23S rRNA pseudouridine955/2504/2580 synthase
MIYKILRQGQVRVNRGRITPGYRLKAGDLVRIPPLRTRSAVEREAPPAGMLERLRQAILREDEDILVIDKPAGIAVHKGSGVEYGVIEVLRALRPELPFLELAHRLDRETSGCLLLAKKPEVLRSVQAALRRAGADKRYLALVRGGWHNGERAVTLPLRKNVVRGNERMVEVSDGGKYARSLFRPISVFSSATLLEVEIATGRTHQIRVHAAHIGHPLAGDGKYGDAMFNRRLVRMGLRRLFLHAHCLSLPLGSRDVSVNAPLSQELKAVLNTLEKLEKLEKLE